MSIPAGEIEVVAPNLKRRLSGVTATIARLVPIMARRMGVVATGPGLPRRVPHVSLLRAATLPRNRWRVWHARRNTEMLLGLALRHILGRRYRLVFTSASQRHHSRYTKWLISKMDHVIATSEKTAAYLERPATVILHGIDTEAFAPPEERARLRAKLGLPIDALLVGCYGRIRQQKGTDVFVDAMIRVARDRPGVQALVMGRATEKHQGFERALRERVARESLAGRILFRPEVPVEEMPRWYQALDLFVAPQRWEGFGLTPLEAMAWAVPVVATRVGAFEELIRHDETGLLVAPVKVEEMAGAIGALLEDPPTLAQMGTAARADMLARFRLEREAEEIMSVYRKLLDMKDSP